MIFSAGDLLGQLLDNLTPLELQAEPPSAKPSAFPKDAHADGCWDHLALGCLLGCLVAVCLEEQEFLNQLS